MSPPSTDSSKVGRINLCWGEQPSNKEVELPDIVRSRYPCSPLQAGICDLSASLEQDQLTLLQQWVIEINQHQGRCALIDVSQRLTSAHWKMLTASGLNWLVRPDSLYTALRCTLTLLNSRQFLLVTLLGLSAQDLDPADGLILQAALPPRTTLLFVQFLPWDNSGEPVALPRDHGSCCA
ncbi:MAG: hypothetical protein HC921_03755 [Synechococcaceae cyanobacterium SM2_3_1]|nr:hypothetical protein [Synechococcaceae cyanobacterium SM2_3_1]